MSDIGHIHSGGHARDIEPRPAKRPGRTEADQPGRSAQSPRREPDRIEISPVAREAGSDREIRADLVLRVREQIVRGVYETPEKIEATIDGLTNDLDTRA